MRRRSFIKAISAVGPYLYAGYMPYEKFKNSPDVEELVILHTNDTHSRIEPFPMDGSRNEGAGGVAQRAAVIQRLRQQYEHVLLLDAGDIFQGTPYFNFFHGEVEIKAMNMMAYDAATIGNHDFDGGLENLVTQTNQAQFPFIISNYDFSDTSMHNSTLPYKIFQKGGIRIGVLGIGIQLDGLVPKKLYTETIYLDPITSANVMAKRLKRELDCDYVICLSHLGYKYGDQTISDMVLAQESQNIDLIIGGHTHTFMNDPQHVKNAVGEAVTIHQVGWAGIVLGKLHVRFEKNKKGRCLSCKNILIKS